MNSIKLFVLTLLFFTIYKTTAQVTAPSNSINSTDYLGTNSSSVFKDVIFRRGGIFAGQISQGSLVDYGDVSIGINSFEKALGVTRGCVMIGAAAGKNNLKTINPINVSFGAGNTYIGSRAGMGKGTTVSNAFNDVFIGAESGINITSGINNVFVGTASGAFNEVGSESVLIGHQAGYSTNASGNVYVGNRSGVYATGQHNTYLGFNTGYKSVIPILANSGSDNTFLGYQCGATMTTGFNNTFVGKVILPSVAATSLLAGNTTSNTIILATGNGALFNDSGSQRLYIHSNGNAGFDIGNNNIPQNRLEINSTGPGAVANTLGLRFRNFPSASVTNPTSKVLSVNAQGDVILVDDKEAVGGTITAVACSNPVNFVTKFSAVNNEITCSQIFDNGTSVGIGTSIGVDPTLGFGYSSSGATGIVKLDVQGVTRTAGFFITSDKKFKKDIKPIESSLEKVLTLDGKTYNWRNEEFKDKNFGNELQYGFLAQEVQKVIPSLVIQSENGDLAMNYIGLIPVLIEAMKEQQTQINELKFQITDNFRTQNQDLLQFANTKIISVSPNPSDDEILISVNIDKEVTAAQLQVHDINGTVVSLLNLKERATNISKSLQKDNFGKGIYIVSLVINGKSIDTKKIIFN